MKCKAQIVLPPGAFIRGNATRMLDENGTALTTYSTALDVVGARVVEIEVDVEFPVRRRRRNAKEGEAQQQ